MTVEDLDEVLAIEQKSFPLPWTWAMFERELENPVSFSYTVRVRDGGGEALGAYIIFWIVYGEAHILDFAVHPDLRRRGLATWLLENIISRLREGSVIGIFLEVRKSNAPAIELYKKFGFKESYERKKYYGDEDALVMTFTF